MTFIGGRRTGSLFLFAGLALGPAAYADQYPRQPGVEVRNYVFDLTLGDASNEITVKETVEVSFTSSGVDRMDFDLCNLVSAAEPLDPLEPCQAAPPRLSAGSTQAARTSATNVGKGMTVTSVSTGDETLNFEHRANRLRIQFPGPSRAGERMTLSLTYHGVPAAGLFTGTNKFGDRVFFSDNWPNKARNWLATIDHISVKAPKTLIVTAPRHYQVISNGLLMSQIDLPNDLRRSTWRESVPIPSWQFSLGVAPMAVEYLGALGGVPFSAWMTPQNRDEDLKTIVPLNEPVFEFYSQRIGPYAYEKLAHVEATGSRGGFEFATTIFYHDGAFAALAHEMAHQWFGDSVTEADWDDVWLSEGFATYFSLLYTEYSQGHDAFVQGVRRTRDSALKYALAHPTDTMVHDNLASDSKVLFNAPQIYSGGAMALHTLRGVVGDRIFWAGIRLYYRRHRDGSATTDDFRRAMEDACSSSGSCPPEAADLSWFFQQWLHRGGVPRVRGSWHYDAASRKVNVSLGELQTQGFYRIPVELAITLPSTSATKPAEPSPDTASVKRVNVVLDGPLTTASFAVDAPPLDVQLDPDTWVPLMQATFGK